MKTSLQAGVPGGAALAQALDSLWRRFEPEIAGRVAILESAAAVLADGHLTKEQREAAQIAAHKLAGVLGSFGLARGTAVARDLELALSGEPSRNADWAPHLAAAAAELRDLVKNRRSEAGVSPGEDSMYDKCAAEKGAPEGGDRA